MINYKIKNIRKLNLLKIKNKSKKYLVPMRLDQYLLQKFTNYSRAFLKRQIKAGNVLVNGKIKKPSYILKENDKIKVKISLPEKQKLQSNPNLKLNIVYEDENIIVLDKPAGIAVHPTDPKQTNTLVNALLAYYPEIENIGDFPELRPGIVHRLDKNTSGLLVIAKNNQIFKWLKQQFQERKVIKKYIALVLGKIKEKYGVISKSIGHIKGVIKRTVTPSESAREAITYYKTIKYYRDGGSGYQVYHSTKEKNYTLVEVEPKTGRTHQIRVHLASTGHPVAGDKLYGFKRQTALPNLKRHFLHASFLKFKLPSGKMVEFKSELPRDLQKIINNLQS